VTRFRGTIVKVPEDGGPGVVFADAAQRPFVLSGIWRSAVPPAAGQLVDVDLDEAGRVASIAVVGSELSAPPPAPVAVPIAPLVGDNIASPSRAAPAKRRSRLWRYGRWVLGGMLVLSIVGFIVVRYVVIPTMIREVPLIAVGAAAEAYRNHDLPAFKSYVDVSAVFEDATDQLAPQWLAGAIKKNYVPDLVTQVDQLVARGTLPDGVRQGASDEATEASRLKDVLQAVVNGLKFEGLGPSTVNGDEAHIEVRLIRGNRLLAVQSRLHWTQDHWRVVAIEHLAPLIEGLL